jgi:O-antigen/teichoic acid export membrane protein
MQNVFVKIGRDTAVLSIGNLANRAAAFFLVPLYTHYFTTADYGLLELANIAAAMIGILAALGMASAFSREFLHKADSDTEKAEVTATSLIFLSVFSLGVAACAYFSADYLVMGFGLKQPVAADLLRLLAVQSYFSILSLMGARYLIVTGRITLYAVLSVVQSILSMLASVYVIVVKGQGLYGLFLVQTIVIAVAGVGYSVFLLKRSGLRWSSERIRNMLIFGIPMVPAAISFFVMTSADRFFILRLMSTDDVGVYSMGAKIAILLQILLIVPLTTAIGPQIYHIDKQVDSGKVMQHLLELTTFVLVGGAVALSLFAPCLVRLLSPPAYWQAASLVIWLSLANVLFGLNFVLVAGINISGKSYYQTIAIAVAAGLNIVLNWALIYYLGILGAAIATTAAFLIQTILTGLFAQCLYPIPYRFLRTAGFTCVLLICYGALEVLPAEPIFAITIVKSFLFSSVLLIMAACLFKTETPSLCWKLRHGLVALFYSRCWESKD